MKVLAISGSLRKDSFNRKALQIAKSIAQELGAEVNELDLQELNLPMYDQDIEDKGYPESVKKLKAAITACDLLLIASPEYNYSISGALKNALDWGSREKHGSVNVWSGKTAAIFGASTGGIGTARGQMHLRVILADLDVLTVSKPELLIKMAKEAFNSDGSFNDQKTHEQMRKLVMKAVELTQRMKN